MFGSKTEAIQIATPHLERFKSDIPAGRSGNWRVQKFEIERDGLSAVMAMIQHPDRPVAAGKYTRLVRIDQPPDGPRPVCVMSDTPAEIMDHLPFIAEASGNVLVTGLGLGVVAKALADKPEVRHVTVIERSPDVIDLVRPHLRNEKLTVIHSDAYEYPRSLDPTAAADDRPFFQFGWHDIWDSISPENLEEMIQLKFAWDPFVNEQSCWCEGECMEMERVERAMVYIAKLAGFREPVTSQE